MSERTAEPFRDDERMAGFAHLVVEHLIARLKDEGLVHDDRPPLTLEQTAVRLGVSRRVITDMTRGVDGRPPVLATIKVGAGEDERGPGHKGIRVEPREIDRYLQQRRREWMAQAYREPRCA